MAAVMKGVVSDHHCGEPVTVEVWGKLQEAGTWLDAWYYYPKHVTQPVCSAEL